MPNYTEFMMRHGEFGVQTIIEQIEQQDGIVPHPGISLEQRWEELMRALELPQQPLAA